VERKTKQCGRLHPSIRFYRSNAKRSKLPDLTEDGEDDEVLDTASGEERPVAHAGEHGGLLLGQVLQPLLIVVW